KDGKLLARFVNGHKGAIAAVAISPDGKFIATGGTESDRSVCLWDRKALRVIRKLPGHTLGVSALAFSPSGDSLVSGNGLLGGSAFESQSIAGSRKFEGNGEAHLWEVHS